MSWGRTTSALLALVILGAACGSAASGSDPVADAARGASLYDTHCASCHGVDGEGMPNWKTPNADGSYPAPPHDSSGHTWHHSDDLLVDLVANGSDFAQSRMPAFGDRLDDDEIIAILEYIKTWWGPDELAFQREVSLTGR